MTESLSFKSLFYLSVLFCEVQQFLEVSIFPSTHCLCFFRFSGLLRSLMRKLGAPRGVRLLTYAKYALQGLSPKLNPDSDNVVKVVLARFKTSLSYLQLRLLLEILELLSWMDDVRSSFIKRLKDMLISAGYFLRNTFPSPAIAP
ncbi:unnamed protein product [Ilex paraguariensis]|uniref:Uncharacterized protein n=1 Tax=Ilex paraguariensis TaxID=185542 RepID=A0ABC8RK89_9AQUA